MGLFALPTVEFALPIFVHDIWGKVNTETMEKILNELMKATDPHSVDTQRRIASLMGVKTVIVTKWANRFKDSLEQIEMVRNQMSCMVEDQKRRELVCPLPTPAEWREADARSLASQFRTSEDKSEEGESLDTVLSEVGSMPAIEKARLQEGASERNLIAYRSLANQIRIKYART